MKNNSLILKTEEYVKEVMVKRQGILTIAHDFQHVDRVRKWALIISDREEYPNTEMVEITALLHDIGLGHLNSDDERIDHGAIGAEIAERFLRSNSTLNEGDIILIADTIKYHSLSPSIVDEHFDTLGHKKKLLEIIRDADNLEAFGAIGIIRGITPKYYLPIYDPVEIKGNTWGLSSAAFKKKFGFDEKKRLAPVNNLIDQIIQQIRYYDNLRTTTARDLGKPFVDYMLNFIIQLESEITQVETVNG